MQSRGKRNTQIEVRKTFIGRMGFIHEWNPLWVFLDWCIGRCGVTWA
jgi:hypothetical protein